jgi:hypothetical protein
VLNADLEKPQCFLGSEKELLLKAGTKTYTGFTAHQAVQDLNTDSFIQFRKSDWGGRLAQFPLKPVEWNSHIFCIFLYRNSAPDGRRDLPKTTVLKNSKYFHR